jgi:hypothetical protein
MTDMDQPIVAGRDAVDVSHHLLYLTEPDMLPQPPFAPGNGLVLSQPGTVVIFVGASSGKVDVEVEARLEPPPHVELDGWDEIAEISVKAPTGQMRARGPMTDPAAGLPILTRTGAGPYRLRVHAKGRDTAPDLVAFTPIERYLLITWPAPAQPEVVYKHSDQYGAGWRQATAQMPSTPPRPADPDEERRKAIEANLRRVRQKPSS